MSTRRTFLFSAGASSLAACAPGEGALPHANVPSSPTITQTVPGGAPSTSSVGTSDPPLSSGTPSTASGPEPTVPWEPPGAVDTVAFAWGVQSGDATPSSVLVSIRTTEPAVDVVLARGVDDGWVEEARLDGLIPDDRVVQVDIAGLDPDTTWSVAAYAVDGLRRSVSARFRTALAPGTRRVVRFGATSCLGGNEPWPTLSRAASGKLDFFLLLGDTIYADANGWGGLDHEASWDAGLQVDGLKDLTASTSVVATWDDHEVDNDWSWDDNGMPETALDALSAFRRAIPQRVGPDGSGIWRTLSWGDVLDLFVLDCRGERLDGDYVSPEQLDWLMRELSASTARFKLICNSVPITDMRDVFFGVAADDRWDGYAHQRDAILDHIEIQGISGVVWLAGDFHFGALTSVGRAGERGEDQWEVFCGPGGSFINPIAFLIPEGDQFERVIPRWNVVLFEADADAGTLRLFFLADDGTVLLDRTLTP